MKSYTKGKHSEGNVVIPHWYRTVLAGKFEICCSRKAEHENKLKQIKATQIKPNHC